MANFTMEERLSDLTTCMRRKQFDDSTIEPMAALFREVEGEVDGLYIFRALEIMNDNFRKARNCICHGMGISYGTEKAKHCFSEELETMIVLEACTSRKPHEVPALLAQACEVPKNVDDKWCCDKTQE